MINKIDKIIITLLLKICEILTTYSKKVTSYDLYVVRESINDLSSMIEEDKECEENGDKE